MDSIPLVRLRGGAHRRVRRGHLWIYRDELAEPLPALRAGDLVRVETTYGYDLGVGFFHPSSKIAVRLLQWHGQVDEEFFRLRFQRALILRQRLFGESNVYRLVFGEADFLPGLIVDRYDKWLAVQYLAAGMEHRSAMIVEALRSVFPELCGIVAKNDSVLREKEGLRRQEEVLWGSVPNRITIELNGIAIVVDLLGGQKTGLYLDQRINYELVSRFAPGRRVLDCFTHEGGFALHCARAGAVNVVGVDSSAAALQLARENALLNNLQEQCHFIEADVFDYLKQAVGRGEHWDMVILDPPALQKAHSMSSEPCEVMLKSIAVRCNCSMMGESLLQRAVRTTLENRSCSTLLLLKHDAPVAVSDCWRVGCNLPATPSMLQCLKLHT